MPSLSTARRVANAKNNGAKTIGQIYKEQSDWAMEQTFENDIATKTCYIYDYFHDDFFTDEHGITRSLAEGMTYENTNKTKIDAKFIVKSYQSMDKDQVEYYLMFRPSQPVRFNEGDDLYYYETDFRKRYGATFPIGLFVDVPDDRGVYHKWIVCRDEPANQFPKYLILPVNYELTWIEKSNDKRIKRRMWCCLRQQNSYTIGIYTDRYFTHTDNQDKILLPMNSITEKFWYTSEDSKNMRVVVSALTEHPTVWTVTKVENSMPFGIQKLTIYTAFWNEHTDYVNLETGEMYADYFDSEIVPTDPDTKPTPSPVTNILATITSSASTIKVGGSYRTLNIKLSNDSGEDITDTFGDRSNFEWHFEIDDEEYKGIIRNDLSFYRMKIKFPDDYDYVGKILTIYCTITNETLGYIHSEKLQLEITE